METSLKKYHLLIDQAIVSLANSAKDQKQFDESCIQLQAVVPTYGLTLRHMNILLNEITDPKSQFRVSMKNKMITILVPRELLDFKIVMKIIKEFKVSSYYSQRAKIKVLPMTIQSKLAQFLLKNIINIKWESKCLCFGNIMFDLLAIGYLRSEIGLFLLYFLNIAKQIDSQYDLRYFINIKKLQSIIELYEMDSKSILPLLVFTNWYLETIDRSEEFDELHYILKHTIQNAKFTKDMFGKLNATYIAALLSMDRDSLNARMLEDNICLIQRIITNLNTNFIQFTNSIGKKRKYLEAESDQIEHPKLYNIYSPGEFVKTVRESKTNSNILSILKYFSTTNLKQYQPTQTEDVPVNGLELNFCAFNPAMYFMTEYDLELMNYQIMRVLNIKNNILQLTNDMHWVFISLSNMSRFTGKLFPLMDNIFTDSLTLKYTERKNNIYSVLNVSEQLQYLPANYPKYQKYLNKILDYTFAFNDSKMMKGITKVICNWKTSINDYKPLVRSVLEMFRVKNAKMITDMLMIYNSTHSVPFELINFNIVFRPDLIVLCLTTRNLYKIDLLLKHLLFTNNFLGTVADMVYKKINLIHIKDTFGILFRKQCGEPGILRHLLKSQKSEMHLKLCTMAKEGALTDDQLSLKMKNLCYYGIYEFYETFKTL